MSCSAFTPGECITDAITGGMGELAKSFADGASWSVKIMMSTWLKTPSPDISSASTVGWLQDRLAYFVLFAALLSVMYAAYRMATSGQFEHAGDLAQSLFRLIVVSGCVVAATTIGIEVGDAYTVWILSQASPDLFGFGVVGFMTALTTPAVKMMLALVVILAQIIQMFIMLVKNLMIVALVGFIPLTSAATNTPTGKHGYQKALTWLAAFVLYKPVAATIYALSFRLSRSDNSIADQMSGVAAMVLAILALPALMRFLVPATASVTGGNAGAMAGAVVGATLATGAVLATGGASAGAGGFASVAGPSGAAMGAAGSGGASGAVPTAGALNAASAGASFGGGNNHDNDPVDRP